jgi:hypothetical protein
MTVTDADQFFSDVLDAIEDCYGGWKCSDDFDHLVATIAAHLGAPRERVELVIIECIADDIITTLDPT